ncbi:MAG: peptide MFS transporter [Polyangiaceae bacterium]
MAEATVAAGTEAGNPPKGHPLGLYFLFFTEMWERFSYYGMRALLVPYMISTSFGYQPSEASSVYKWYTSLVYLTPILGGLIADRLIGARAAVLIGAVLMAVGHFLMAFPAKGIFFLALAFLIAGNGFFKPNISTMVGRLYPKGDARRDRAFTIFYMGINLGAFGAGLVCPSLKDGMGFHWGFGAAGVGMVIGLVVFTFGQKRVVSDIAVAEKKDADAKKESPEAEGAGYRDNAKSEVVTEDAQKPKAGGLASVFGAIYPFFMYLSAASIVGIYAFKVATHQAKPILLIMPIAFGAVFVIMATVLLRLKGAEKEKSTSIFIMFLFPVLFWMAFEQAGNALNLWAEIHTDRVVAGKTYPGGWWQSANALMIFVLAPVFAFFWGFLARKGKEPSTAGKMFGAMAMMVASFGVMVVGAMSEHATESRVKLERAPALNEPLDAGRLTYDAAKKELVVRGVLPEFAVRDALKKTSSEAFHKWLDEAKKQSAEATKDKPFKSSIDVAVFDMPTNAEALSDLRLTYSQAPAGEGATPPRHWKLDDKFDLAASAGAMGRTELTLTAQEAIDAAHETALYAAVAEPEWKKALNDLAKESQKARVSGIWLFLSYLLATLGELCLSPVGLSMVTKLAPARFASLFMGVWLLTSSVAQYVGGSIGESWGTIPPVSYFWIFIFTSAGGVVLTLALGPVLRRLMHDVK